MSKWIFGGCKLESHHFTLQKGEETPLIPCSAEDCLGTWGVTPALILPELSLQGMEPGGRSFSAMIPLGPKGWRTHMGKEKERSGGPCCHPVRAGVTAFSHISWTTYPAAGEIHQRKGGGPFVQHA